VSLAPDLPESRATRDALPGVRCVGCHMFADNARGQPRGTGLAAGG